MATHDSDDDKEKELEMSERQKQMLDRGGDLEVGEDKEADDADA